jgi:hypothetical protein
MQNRSARRFCIGLSFQGFLYLIDLMAFALGAFVSVIFA